MTTFEMSPEKYISQYIHLDEQHVSRNMALGSLLADGLEEEEATGNPLLDFMMPRIPKFKLMDKIITDIHGMKVEYKHPKTGKITHPIVPVLEDKKENIPILAKPDSAKPDYTALKEYKTSTRKWTQKMVDESGQITFYATAIWLKTAQIPQEIELVDIQTNYDENGAVGLTGELWRYPTRRSMSQIIRMTRRMRDAWAGIETICRKELIN